jgi:hypothetical protein
MLALRRALSFGSCLAAAAAPWIAPAARANSLPFVDQDAAPLQARIASAEIIEKDEPLFTRPGPKAPRRGSAAQGAHLPIFSVTRASGCRGRWLMVGPIAWVCEDRVRLSNAPALDARKKPEAFPDGLPYRYHFVGRYGALGYNTLSSAEEGSPDAELEPGFSIGVLHQANKAGESFAFTTKNIWIPMRDLGPARPSSFHGEEITDGKLEFGWVYEESARVYSSPGGSAISGEVRTQWQKLPVLEEKTREKRRWFRIGDKQWVSDHHVRVPTRAETPSEVLPGERWIDVDIPNQVVTAYEGDRPVFATLSSTGKGRGKSIQATPVGIHRIWVKLRSSDMDNLENEEASRYYAIQDVPWVMYFKKGYGLHGTFWHRSFGRVRSHGCVNLTPLDAQRLFAWTSPKLPTGWSAVIPTEYEQGTLVRVR